jgi:hypothetical protein
MAVPAQARSHPELDGLLINWRYHLNRLVELDSMVEVIVFLLFLFSAGIVFWTLAFNADQAE